ncbi:MAG: ATP-binding cassette domain-containing protein, partial [Lactobacillaceae bacterium]
MKLLVDRISKSNILDNISFSVGDGDRIALVGPNGAGKTTLLNVIMNLVTPT